MTETLAEPRATLADLHRYPDGKFELIDGRIQEFPMPGDAAARIGGNIYFLLRLFVMSRGRGQARPDSLDYALLRPLRSGRESFRPDASFYSRPPPADGREFVQGPPDLAVEVRSGADYGPDAERAIAAKVADYLEAGTAAVWDVDPQARTVTLHRRDRPGEPLVFRAGQAAHAEPAVPGWSVPVDDIFA
jgi:Uma2 family endonuclease